MRLSQSMVSRGKGKKNKRNQASSSSSQRSSSSGSDRIRARKKQKRLDSICEQVYNRNHVAKIESNEGNVAVEAEAEADAGLLRRSSRVRRAPALLLDASPSPVRKRPRIDNVCSSSSKKNEGNVDRKKVDDGLEKTTPVQNSEDLDMDDPDSWKSRLRSRANHVSFALIENNASPRRRRRLFDDSGGSKEDSRVASREMDDKKRVVEAKISVAKTKKRPGKGIAKGSTTSNSEDHTSESFNNKEEHNVSHAGERISRLDNEDRLLPNSAMDCGDEKVEADNSSTRTNEKEEKQMLDDVELDEEERDNMDLEPMIQSPVHLDQADGEKDELNCASAMETAELPGNQLDNGDSRGSRSACVGEPGGKPLQEDQDIKVGKMKNSQTDTLEKIPLKEGRRCGLCGGGIDGKPPKRLLRDSVESDNDTYDRSSFSEEVNYDVLDGFGDDPRWLGRLLGPINDRFGIAGVWVHQNCAVWSPEVYFAGLGCLKNVRAALCRGRSLKCSRCGRPGATIGCRVDRCPKTYHLPCGRADGCIFYHRKFLIACIDHRHLFQPHGGHQINQLKEIKVKKMKLEMRKHSYDASRKDLEVEEKWLEKCGEDEEFLKRESKRLQRDLLRIAPVYIGGSSSENDNLFQGWESVAGLQDVIQCMKEVVILPLLYPEVFNSLGLTPPRGVLLHGYPGTGKTLVVRALIGSCARGDRRIAYFARKGADCLGKYVGDAERQLRLLFQVAEKAQPSIIFFDEIDGLAPCRTRQQDQTHNSVVSTLLALMDGLKSRGSVIVIGATNRPESVDPALRRPGRFDREVYFPLPSVKDRTSILSLHTRRWPKPIYGSLLKWIAQQTAGFAGADLQALCTQAVMIALKRNFPLQELMSAAEKKATNGRCPPLPSFPVEERDWLDALACAPPPCSRREAGMAANDVVSSPLRSHHVPFLLQPLSHLLVSLFRDERVLLPPSLNKASKLIKGILISTLEKMQKSTDLWWRHVHDLIQDADVAEKIKTSLSSVGLLIGSSTFVDSNVLDDDNDKGNEKFERHKVNLTGPRPNLLRNISTSSGRASGFRVLIAGSPKFGQSHLAACILHGFVGHVEIQKINLATISQEGRGDVVQGMTHILMKCARAGLCIIYMPRIDLWAMQTDHLITETESDICANTDESTDLMKDLNATKTATQAWNSFVEQMDSLYLTASLMVLATSEVSNKDLPSRISQFFTGDISSTNDSAQQTVPSFLVQLDGNYDSDIVVSASATELTQGLVEQYVQLIHHGTHTGNMCKEIKISCTMDSKPEIEYHPTENGTVDEESVSLISGMTASRGVAPYNEDQIQQNINIDKQGPPMPQTVDNQENEVRLSYPQDSVPRVIPNNRSVKGKSSSFSAISTFGYQILRYPHFSELCWTTSKLKEGPCTDINGPWKGWPFNSCIIRPKKAVENVAAGWSSSNFKNKEHSGIVRGLTAVGILAYKGVYTSVREVSFEVRKVLELLVKQIDAKIVGGKDRYRFLRLLSQVAYLEDMVNNWAYSLQSLDDNQLPTPTPVPTIAAFVENPTGSSALKPNISPRKVNEENMRDQSPDKLATGDGDHMDPSGVTDTGLPTSKARVAISEEPSIQIASLDPQSSSMTANNLPVGITSDACNKRSHANNCIPENHISGPMLNGDYAFSRLPNDLTTEEMVLPSKGCVRIPGESGVNMNLSTRIVNDHCNGTAEIFPSRDSISNRDEAVTDGHLIFNKSNGASTASGLTCMYNCCSACLHAIYLLIQKVLLQEKERNESWTVEDVHDAVSSISVNLLAAVRKFCITESDRNPKLLSEKRRQKSGTCQEVGSNQSREASCQCKGSGNCLGMPIVCSCHLKNDRSSADNFCTNSQSGLDLNLVFRDGVLIPSGSIENVLLHCKYEKLCLGSLIELVLTIKQPSG